MVLEHGLEQVLRQRGRAAPAASSRSLALAAQRDVACAGRRRTRSGRCAAASSSRRASASSSGSGWSWRRIVNAGTQRSVTRRDHAEAARARRARPATGRGRTRASTRPSSRPRSPARSPRPGSRCCRSRSPVPCVAVEIAPAIVCTSMSPRFSSARPCVVERLAQVADHDRRPRPSPAAARESTSSTRFSRSSRTITPSVQAMSVKEWPEAAARTVCARARRAARRPPAARSTRAGPLDRRRHALLVTRPVAPHGGKPNRAEGGRRRYSPGARRQVAARRRRRRARRARRRRAAGGRSSGARMPTRTSRPPCRAAL